MDVNHCRCCSAIEERNEAGKMTILFILLALLILTYIVLRFTFGFKRLWVVEEMECDRHGSHHDRRNG